MELQAVRYEDLSAREKESYNFQEVSAVLAGHGFATLWLNDGRGADFVARRADGSSLMVQMTSRLTFDREWRGLHVCFPDGARCWYLCPHDELLARVLGATTMGGTVSWKKRGRYSFSRLREKVKALLEPSYVLGGRGHR